MTHRQRILRALAGLPKHGRSMPGVSRNVLEGMTRTERDKRAAAQLVDYMIALGEIVMRGERRGAVYGLPGQGRVRAG